MGAGYAVGRGEEVVPGAEEAVEVEVAVAGVEAAAAAGARRCRWRRSARRLAGVAVVVRGAPVGEVEAAVEVEVEVALVAAEALAVGWAPASD